MPIITGEIRDAATGQKVEARVQVLGPTGNQLAPEGALFKVGPGEPFFYSNGQFSVQGHRGYHRVLVERGTEYRPWSAVIDLESAAVSLDIGLERWSDLPDRGWHPGNTHIHYDEKESRPDERLRHDSRVEDLRMTSVSILRRWDLPYASNKYPPGVLTEFTDTHHFVQSGEETRHNEDPDRPYHIGYGHVMLLNIDTIVEPVSRGLLIDPFSPDYPPLSYACDAASERGGLVIWCHNGQGMEAPVAAALGKVHAINLFDPYWNDVEYDLWYHMLNCGIRLPASTGSDWFVCSANRVYSQTGGPFTYEAWLESVRRGETFITNGPAIFLEVAGSPPGATVEPTGGNLPVTVTWSAHYPVRRVEIVINGRVAESRDFPNGSTAGELSVDARVGADGWIAVRLASSTRDSFDQPQWAHTSPVYVSGTGRPPDAQSDSARFFVDHIDRSLEWVRTKGRFYSDAQRREVVDLHRAAQDIYRKMLR